MRSRGQEIDADVIGFPQQPFEAELCGGMVGCRGAVDHQQAEAKEQKPGQLGSAQQWKGLVEQERDADEGEQDANGMGEGIGSFLVRVVLFDLFDWR